MDITNLTFTEDEESLQSQTLKESIKHISRRLILNSTPSPSNSMMGSLPSDPNSPNASPEQETFVGPRTPTITLPLNASFIFVPSPYSFHTPRPILVNIPRADTPVLSPPSGFRDRDEDVKNEPFDLTTDSALDLRVQPTQLDLRMKSEVEQDQPLALVKSKEESSFSDISTQTHSCHCLTPEKTTSTCTSLDETVYYPFLDTAMSIQEECVSKNITSKQTSTSTLGHSVRQSLFGRSEDCKNTITGLDTIKHSYAQLADDTYDGTSTTAIIDDAFHYLTDIPDESSQAVSDNHCDYQQSFEPRPTESDNSSNCRSLNTTYDVVFKPILIKKPPTGANHKPKNADMEDKQADPCDSKHEQKSSTSESSSDLSSESSSFTLVTSLESDANKSLWSVKQAVTNLTSGLTLTLTKAASASTSSTVDSPKVTQAPESNLSSTPRNRVVIGSNNSIEESTIVKEASQIVSNSQHSVVSRPATPDVSVCNSNHSTSTSHTDCNTNAAIEKVLSSTRREIRKEPIGDEITPKAKSKEESLRTKLMKKSVSIKPLSTDSDSVLNIAFRKDAKKETPLKRKKKSLFSALKKQFRCNNPSNASQLSQHDQTVTATCLGRISKPQTQKKQSCSPNFLNKCTNNAENSCATISFVTLDRSSYSTPMPAWCRQIISTTETTSTPKPISTPAKESKSPPKCSEPAKTSRSKSVGISTSSLTNPNQDDTQYQRPNPLFDSVGISWLSQIDSFHSPNNKTTKSTSTTTHDLPRMLPAVHSSSRCELTEDRLKGSNSSAPCSDMLHPKVVSPPAVRSDISHPQSSSPQEERSDKSRSRSSSPQSPSMDSSNTSPPFSFDNQQAKHVKHWMALSSTQSQLEMISKVGRLTAEWLTSFIMDTTMNRFQSYFDIQPNRNVMLELCHMCNIRVKVSSVDQDLLVLTKTSTSRAPTETDVKRLIRKIRR